MDHGWIDSGNGYYYVGGGIGIFLLIIILICIVWALQWPTCNDGGGYPYGSGGYWYPYYSRVSPCDIQDPASRGPRVCAVSIDSRYVEGRGIPSAAPATAVVVGGGFVKAV